MHRLFVFQVHFSGSSCAIFLKEKIGLRRTLAALVGFTGVLIMLDPGGDYNFAPLWLWVLQLPFAFAAILVNIVSKYDSL